MNKNYIFSSTPKYKVLARRLKRVVLKSMKYIIDSLKYSDFEVLGNEVEFKDQKEYKPIEISLDDGKKVEVTGKIGKSKTEEISILGESVRLLTKALRPIPRKLYTFRYTIRDYYSYLREFRYSSWSSVLNTGWYSSSELSYFYRGFCL